jgi:hypothetical protein
LDTLNLFQSLIENRVNETRKGQSMSMTGKREDESQVDVQMAQEEEKRLHLQVEMASA